MATYLVWCPELGSGPDDAKSIKANDAEHAATIWARREDAESSDCMSKAGRMLKPGDDAVTDYNGKGMTLVRIVDRLENTASQSRICFRVTPTLKNGTSESLYDADWFEPAPRDLL